MIKINPIKKRLLKENRKAYQNDPLKLLADFFNGVVIELDDEYSYES